MLEKPEKMVKPRFYSKSPLITYKTYKTRRAQRRGALVFYFSYISIQGVQGGIQEGPEPIPELKNYQVHRFSKIRKND